MAALNTWLDMSLKPPLAFPVSSRPRLLSAELSISPVHV
jgi:hypothetical protein